jgi:DnaK suppressor protein
VRNVEVQESELKYFKEILESRREQINKNISSGNNELIEINSLDLNDEGDHASANNNSMIETAIMQQQQKELGEIKVALVKITNRDYGICNMCEEPIGFQRLKVKPHAMYCIHCREIVEKSK